MTYKELLRETWETIKEVTSTPLSPEKMTWKEAFRILRRSLLLGLWRCFVGFAVFFVLFLAVVTFLRAWAVVMHLVR